MAMANIYYGSLSLKNALFVLTHKKTKEEKINCLFIGIVNDFYYLCSKIFETF